MVAIPRYRAQSGPALFSAGFRPFFLLGALWAAVAIPLWLALFSGAAGLPTALSPAIWHAHEMIYGYAAAIVAGFLLTAIPNWTGRMPLQGAPLAGLVLLWLAGRAAMLASAAIGPVFAALCDLAFPVAMLATVAREILAGRNWRNLPILAALTLLLIGNLLVHLDALDFAATAELGSRLGIATLVMLIVLVGGRIVPSFTRNWLAKQRPDGAFPAAFDGIDRAAMATAALALIAWVAASDSRVVSGLSFAAALALAWRLLRWHGLAARREPLVWILHLGYGWLVPGFLLLGIAGFVAVPSVAALHVFTVGAIGTMTLAVMTRASLGHTGQNLTAGPVTMTIYLLVTAAALLRLAAPFAGGDYLAALMLSGIAWSGAFGLFVLGYGPVLLRPRARA